jgi:SAM-dependent methyltransferase
VRDKQHADALGSRVGDGPVEAMDEREFFTSFYKANVRGRITDRTTIGGVTDAETRFHYNCVENSIIRAVARREGPVAMIEAHRAAVLRERRRHVDVGSGAGHWLDFFREVLLASELVGVEITEQVAAHLREKYGGDAGVRVLCCDVVDPQFVDEVLAIGPADSISAIGVMFHIVDDTRWKTALQHLAAVLKPGGVLFVGGEFGTSTRDVQFHGADQFSTWGEFARARAGGTHRVSKRVRSLADWVHAASDAGFEVADLVRSDRDPALTTPENDVLVLEKRRT